MNIHGHRSLRLIQPQESAQVTTVSEDWRLSPVNIEELAMAGLTNPRIEVHERPYLPGFLVVMLATDQAEAHEPNFPDSWQEIPGHCGRTVDRLVRMLIASQRSPEGS